MSKVREGIWKLSKNCVCCAVCKEHIAYLFWGEFIVGSLQLGHILKNPECCIVRNFAFEQVKGDNNG